LTKFCAFAISERHIIGLKFMSFTICNTNYINAPLVLLYKNNSHITARCIYHYLEFLCKKPNIYKSDCNNLLFLFLINKYISNPLSCWNIQKNKERRRRTNKKAFCFYSVSILHLNIAIKLFSKLLHKMQ